MSSWERSRRIPWSKIQQGSNEPPEKYRERLYNEMKREEEAAAIKTETETDLNKEKSIPKTTENKNGSFSSKGLLRGQKFSTPDLFRHVAFGGCIGTITGATFGCMDSLKEAYSSTILKRASTGAKMKFMMQGVSRSGFLFGAFFGSFHAVKYGIRVVADPGKYAEVIMAGMVSTAALAYKPTTRASLPYATMLIAMDTAHLFMRDM